MDGPDTDLHATLAEVRRDGRYLLLTQDYLRARYRESPAEALLVTPGQVTRYEFGGFTLFSRRIAQGSRLRLVIHSPNSVYVQKNYNSGGDVARETAGDARVAHISLFHDAEHPSHLDLPWVAQNAASKEGTL
jgi:predicted acyl esterase